MSPLFEIMGDGRQWAKGLFSLETYCHIQFWAAVLVFGGCLAQLHVGRKFRAPASPGNIATLGYCIGIWLRNPWLSLRLGDVGAFLDTVMHLIGRLGIALQGVVALFAMDDVVSLPTSPRPLATFLLVAIVMVQARAFTAYTPRETQ